jgi:hypothetical protein
MDAALEVGGEEYNVYVPIANDLGAMGKKDEYRNLLLRRIVALEITSNRCRKMLEHGSCWPRIMRNSIEWKRPSRNCTWRSPCAPMKRPSSITRLARSPY